MSLPEDLSWSTKGCKHPPVDAMAYRTISSRCALVIHADPKCSISSARAVSAQSVPRDRGHDTSRFRSLASAIGPLY